MRLTVYLSLALIAFIAATAGSDVFVSTSTGGQSLSEAISEHVHWATAEPISTLWLLAPFVGLALLCAALEKVMRLRSAVAIFGAGALALMFLYFHGYESAQQFALKRMWTAATVSVAFLPFKSVLVLLVAVAAGGFATKFDPVTKPKQRQA